MAHEELNDIFKNLEGAGVEPSKAVWAGINRRLWWLNFTHFSVLSFNIYYAGLITILLGIGVVYFGDFNDLQPAVLSGQQETLQQKVSPEDQAGTTGSKEVETQTASTLDIETEKVPSSPKSAHSIVTENTPASAKEASGTDGPKPSLAENHIQSEPTKNSHQERESGSQFQDSAASVSPVQEALHKESAINNTTVGTEKNTETELSARVQAPELKQEIEPVHVLAVDEQGDNTVYYDTIKVFDTIPVFDTLKVQPKVKANFSDQKRWSFDLYTGVNGGKYDYVATPKDYQNTLNNASSLHPGMNFGLAVNYSMKNWLVQSGLEYTQLNENFSFVSFNSSNSSEYWNYTPVGTEHFIDTLSWEFVYNPEDSAFILIPVIRDSVVTLYDSTLIKIPETEYKNKYTYLQIPLHVSYPLYADQQFALRAKIGGAIGIWLSGKGKTVYNTDPYSLESIDAAETPFARISLNWRLGLEAEYRIGERYRLIINPYYRRGTQSVYESNPMFDLILSDFGVNAGIRYEF